MAGFVLSLGLETHYPALYAFPKIPQIGEVNTLLSIPPACPCPAPRADYLSLPVTGRSNAPVDISSAGPPKPQKVICGSAAP